MDYKIQTDGVIADSLNETGDTLYNSIYLSLMVKKGSFFQNPSFGSNLHLLAREKNTEKAAALAKNYCREATRWILDIGRSKSIDFKVQIVKAESLYRMKIQVQAVRMTGEVSEFEIFKRVV